MMRLEKISIVIVIIVALIIAAVPLWRVLALSPFRQIGNINNYDFQPSIPNPHKKTNKQLLESYPRDFLLHLGLVNELIIMSDGRANEAVDALIRAFPKQKAAYAVALNAPSCANVEIPQRMESWSVNPDEARKHQKNSVPPTKDQIQGCLRCIELLDRAIAVDPDNGFFHYVKASYLFGLHKDAEALDEIHLAAIAPQFCYYTNTQKKAVQHLGNIRGDLDPTTQFYVGFAAFAKMRESALIAANLSYAKIRQGHTDEGIKEAFDVIGSGYNMAKHAPSFFPALVGRAIFSFGTSAIDPTFKSEKKDINAQQTDRVAHSRRILTNYGYTKEADILSKQWDQLERVRKSIKDNICAQDYTALTRFSTVFKIAIFIIAILLASGVLWVVSSLLTCRGGGRALWDRRAGITSAFLSSLILAPMIVAQISAPQKPLSPMWFILPTAIILAASIVGLILMLMRTPNENENRKMPVWSLLVAWGATFAGLAYFTRNIENWFELPLSIIVVAVLFIPTLTIVYGLLRCLQSRFGRVRRNAQLTFIATLRYGSAITVGMFAILYLLMMPFTVYIGKAAEESIGNARSNEAIIIQKAFK